MYTLLCQTILNIFFCEIVLVVIISYVIIRTNLKAVQRSNPNELQNIKRMKGKESIILAALCLTLMWLKVDKLLAGQRGITMNKESGIYKGPGDLGIFIIPSAEDGV